MKKVTVCASTTYDIIIDSDILKNCGKYIRESGITSNKAAILTDDTVDKLYSATVENSLISEGFSVVKFVIAHGEDSKSAENFIAFLNFLANNKLTRSDILIALGGGVVGDLCGFCASAYLRGVKFIGIPTTLLSMVDSSVGGKTAINLDAGKNLAGAFYQPNLVLADVKTLNTLPSDIFNDGCAEVIKYGIINDKELYLKLQGGINDDNITDIIENCVKNKRDIVNIDEKDNGIRQLLNLGHTVAHAIEKLSDHKISHGSAVAIGTVYISRISHSLGYLNSNELESIINTFKKYSLPTECEYNENELAEISLSDKKRSGDLINLVMPYSIGNSNLYKANACDLLSLYARGKN